MAEEENVSVLPLIRHLTSSGIMPLLLTHFIRPEQWSYFVLCNLT
jgi:hypothetical protein